MQVKRYSQRLNQVGSGTFIALSEGNGDREFISAPQIDFTGQRDVTFLGGGELPVHLEIVHQILPTIAETHVANRTARKAGIAAHNNVKAFPLSTQQLVCADFRGPPRISRTVSSNVWCQKRVQFQFPA